MESIWNTQSKDSMCVLCKGRLMLCGKERCPVIVRCYSQLKIKSLILNKTTLEGSSPPAVFIGRIGYPYVYAGPLIPPIYGDTSILDTPELWIDKEINEIVAFRTNLVRGKYKIEIKNFEDKTVETIREFGLANNSVESEITFNKPPSGKIVLGEDIQPYGPAGILKKIVTGNIKYTPEVEKAYYDFDLKARDAVISLYDEGVIISKIQKAFSVGALGEKMKRKFVPTRWSITAVDNIIGKMLVEKVKYFPIINEYRVYETLYLDNRFIILLIPYSWRYELMEAWYPNTIWNMSNKTVIFSDSEGYDDRTTYATIGGCYYAARLAICEKLNAEKRQASAIVLREAHPGYIMPVGVWNVRESVRHALKEEYKKFDDVSDALKYISTKLDINMKQWIKNSNVLNEVLYQTSLSLFS